MTGSKRFKISIVVPESPVARTGNRCTANQWAEILSTIGHEVVVERNAFTGEPDLLIALHAGHGHEAVRRYRESCPNGKLVVALTGSDIYPGIGPRALSSIEMADRLVVLQRKAIEQIPVQFRGKARVIIQSAQQLLVKPSAPKAPTFDVCVVGHLRDAKDPLRAAAAGRLLPADSKIRIRHAGGVLEPKYRELAEAEMRENPRYLWLGETDESAVAELIASSQIMVISSRFEGGARVVGEALVSGTPVISSRIAGVEGLLGEDYPGYFETGDTVKLANLLRRSESDRDFFNLLSQKAAELAPKFHPAREIEAWRELVAELTI